MRWGIRTRFARKAVLALVLLSQVLAASGAPLPLPASRKDQSAPFPCMSRACGCMTAEQCWRSCCCFTTEQKLAWAERNAVAVPEYVRERAAREKPAPKSCASCAKQTCTQTRDCEHGADRSTPQETGVTWVLGVMASRCQGDRPLGLLVEVPALHTCERFAWSNAAVELDRVPIVHQEPARTSHLPLDPPPRPNA